MKKTIDELYKEQEEQKAYNKKEKARLAEKIKVVGIYPSPSCGDIMWEYMELERAEDILNELEEDFSGKIKIITRTRKWVENLPEL